MNKHNFLLLLLLALSVAAHAQDNQEYTRENPEIEASDSLSEAAVAYPSYVNLSSNHIRMNGDDWSELADIINDSKGRRVSIVHIGDSHLQADMATAVTRRRLSNHYGSAGRGLIVPFKLAGTNQPVDFSISSNSKMLQSRLLKTPWPTAMGFTGIGVHPLDSVFDLSISNPQAFDSVEIFYSGLLIDADSLGAPQDNILGLKLPFKSDAAQFQLRGDTNTTIHGINLISDSVGVAYHVIGNNGATCKSYSEIPDFSKRLESLHPQLLIISLGTNEAYNRISDSEMSKTLDDLVTDLKTRFPRAKLLLTTPSESYRKVTRRRGRKRRRRTSYQINSHIKHVRDVIVNYGETEGIPVYDFYEVAGGKGSAGKWLSDKYLNKDRVHLTHAGYVVQGNLFTDALEEIFSNSKASSNDL